MFNKMVMFAASLVSRGVGNKKTDIETKQLRVLSCFGGIENIGPCPYLRQSGRNSGMHYCGKCGCGDKNHTWLVKQSTDYSKLDYPTLNCPIKMPGFSNYDPNFNSQEIAERRQQIESIDPEKLKLISVTIGGNEVKEQMIEQINKVVENS